MIQYLYKPSFRVYWLSWLSLSWLVWNYEKRSKFLKIWTFLRHWKYKGFFLFLPIFIFFTQLSVLSRELVFVLVTVLITMILMIGKDCTRFHLIHAYVWPVWSLHDQIDMRGSLHVWPVWSLQDQIDMRGLESILARIGDQQIEAVCFSLSSLYYFQGLAFEFDETRWTI